MSSFEDLEAVKQDPKQALAYGVFQIRTSVTTFQLLVNSLGTPKDTPQHREKLRNTRLRLTQLMKDTSAKLKQASDTDQPAEACEIAKLAMDFESSLKEFQEAQRTAAAREVQHAPKSSYTYTPSEEVDRSSDTKSAVQHIALTEPPRKEQQVLVLENDIVFNEAIIEEREQGIREIQNQIVEMSEIFKDLAVLVHEQGDCILDIDSHVQKSNTEIKGGKDELEKAYKTQKSDSSLKCLLWVIFGLVLFIIIIVLAA
ncbi:hypothetical protein MKW94_017626 [Papaver nudicaule]|uniref:t-SNARE coiled-coil homology domain-containing protein n=1 Tax=Papaver nudicaule TaxID=74823 RepID=A0AA41S5B9_PAPNU|nr:hypothetical protein [Papaver nudicaule]